MLMGVKYAQGYREFQDTYRQNFTQFVAQTYLGKVNESALLDLWRFQSSGDESGLDGILPPLAIRGLNIKNTLSGRHILMHSPASVDFRVKMRVDRKRCSLFKNTAQLCLLEVLESL